MAAKFLVVNLQVRPGAAALTLPTIAAQHLLPKAFLQLGITPPTRTFGQNLVHDAFSVTSCRKACLCSPGRNLKNRDMDCRRTVGSSFSRFAPARKSAQIISRHYPRDLSVPSIKTAVSIACSMIGIWVFYSLK